MTLYALAFAALACAALAALVPRARLRTPLVIALVLAAAGFAGAAGVATITSGGAVYAHLAPLAILGDMGFILTPLRGLFAIVTAAVFAASIPFAACEANAYRPPRAALFLALVALLFAAMLAVFAASEVVGFVFAWEIAALAIWALVTFHIRDTAPVAAGYLTLALSEGGALAGMAGLFMLAAASADTSFAGLAAAVSALPAGAVWGGFLLTLFGFGVKAGLVPVNLWLPEAHGAAPRSISPILSGATLNLGVFAIVLIDGPLAVHVPHIALVMLAVGAVTALTGIVYALTERDLKRLLAHSSIENLGIVVAALGAGFAFVSLGKPLLGGIALIAALYHMINHSTYKTLLFLGAGAIDAATGTHDLDRLGGLMRRLPALGTLFLVGAFAIAALPPFNGFVSEWLTLESLLRVVEVAPVPVRITFALCGAALALTAGLALTCFIMVAGSALLGIARSPRPLRPAPASAVIPMGVLAAGCLALGVLATALIPVLGRIVAPLAGGVDATPALVPAFFAWTPVAPHGVSSDLVNALAPIGARVGHGWLPLRGLAVLHAGGAATPVVFAMSTGLTFVVVALLMTIVWLVSRAVNRHPVRLGALWAAGLHRLRPEMTYTGTAFAAPVRVLFDAVLRPVVVEHEDRQGAFVTAHRRHTQWVNIVDRLTLRPVADAMRALAAGLGHIHRGPVTVYAAYILAALLAAMLAAPLSIG